MYKETRYLPAGDQGVVIEFGNEISETVNQKVRGMMLAIESKEISGILEMVPTYRSLLIEYNPLEIQYGPLIDTLRNTEKLLDSIRIPDPVVYEIPTLYGGDHGPDLEFVAGNAGLTTEEVVAIHSSREYLIYMLGFTPGFPYLGGMDERIATPRLAAPRTRISGGSVGIAGSQTGIYPVDSPGGWQLIGKTPLKLYDAVSSNPILLSAGNYIRFVPVTEEHYQEIEAQVSKGAYCAIKYPKGR